MYIITGGSWGIGEWDNGILQHGGLGQYLTEAGQSVINLSVVKSGNHSSYQRLKLFFDSNTHKHLKIPLNASDKILVFQTAWYKDYTPDELGLHFGLNLPQNPKDVDVQTVHSFYHRLSKLAQRYDVPIYLIGGCSDTLWIDQEYSGVHIACQSMTNLCVNDDHRVNEPFLGGISAEMAESLRSKSSSKQTTATILDWANKELARYQVWETHKKWFWPDGVHANREAHYKLFNLLRDQCLIDITS